MQTMALCSAITAIDRLVIAFCNVNQKFERQHCAETEYIKCFQDKVESLCDGLGDSFRTRFYMDMVDELYRRLSTMRTERYQAIGFLLEEDPLHLINNHIRHCIAAISQDEPAIITDLRVFMSERTVNDPSLASVLDKPCSSADMFDPESLVELAGEFGLTNPSNEIGQRLQLAFGAFSDESQLIKLINADIYKAGTYVFD